MPRDKNIFTLNPTSLDMKRSVFPRNSQEKSSCNLGEIVPIFLDADILPGDTVSMDLAQVIRMSTPIAPIMDNLYADIYFFFVPNRIVWSNWEQFCGANETGAWTNTANHSVPVQDIGEDGDALATIGCIGDHFGLPLGDSLMRSGFTGLPDSLEVSELPLRAYYKIYNDWFRDENSIAPVIYTIGDTTNSSIGYLDACLKASRFHDMFSSALPGPQKGASVTLPLGTTADIKVKDSSGNLSSTIGAQFKWGTSLTAPYQSYLKVGTTSNSSYFGSTYNADNTKSAYYAGSGQVNLSGDLVADLKNATASTVNALRTAFQVQKLLERDARGGTRYIELCRSHFGTTSPDARLQRAEYLAGHRFRINVDQVLSTADAGVSGSSIVGQTGAFSKTVTGSSMFTKSFTEHGILMGLMVIRQDHTYSQGLDKYWLKRDRFDWYYPVLANIGEVPIYKSELDCRVGSSNTVGEGSGVFGYQEPWYEYRFKPSRCTGYMNPIVANSLNYWTLGDAFSSVPGLNQTFLEEKPDFLDRALAVQSSVTHQFIYDIYFKAKYARVMPLYSVPGLIDHH